MENWNLISFITSSSLRFKVMIELKKGENIPTRLAKRLNMPISHISKTLSELLEKELIICLTPNRRKGKFFRISELGKEILSSINKLTL